MRKKIVLLLISSVFIFFAASECFAQTHRVPDPPNGNPRCWPPPCPVPIDGGISFLIAAGIALGGKKINDLRKKNG